MIVVMPDDPFGEKVGFTSDKFDGYLSMREDEIYFSFIFSKQEGEGNLIALIRNILKEGYTIKIPCPFDRMRKIAAENNFVPAFESNEPVESSVEVWISTDDTKKKLGI